jgi:hypothetical protein
MTTFDKSKIAIPQAMGLGMKLKKIHKMVRFSQTAWLKTYIEFNSQKRREGASDFPSFQEPVDNHYVDRAILWDIEDLPLVRIPHRCHLEYR